VRMVRCMCGIKLQDESSR